MACHPALTLWDLTVPPGLKGGSELNCRAASGGRGEPSVGKAAHTAGDGQGESEALWESGGLPEGTREEERARALLHT